MSHLIIEGKRYTNIGVKLHFFLQCTIPLSWTASCTKGLA